jgi:hypothetical protein
MKTCNALVAALTLLASTSAFAGVKDLRAFNTLERVGVQTEQFMSQIHLGVDDVECQYSMIARDYECHLKDISANDEKGAELNLTGRKAQAVFELLSKHGAISDNGMGHIFLSLASIRCSQAVPGVAEGTAAERTYCDFTAGQN